MNSQECVRRDIQHTSNLVEKQNITQNFLLQMSEYVFQTIDDTDRKYTQVNKCRKCKVRDFKKL